MVYIHMYANTPLPPPHTHSYAHATLSQVPPQSRFKGITSLIEHPVKVQPPAEPNKTAALPIILTSRERKKLRKQRRREAERDKQEKIQFGLIDKPEPKVSGVASFEVLDWVVHVVVR